MCSSSSSLLLAFVTLAALSRFRKQNSPFTPPRSSCVLREKGVAWHHKCGMWGLGGEEREIASARDVWGGERDGQHFPSFLFSIAFLFPGISYNYLSFLVQRACHAPALGGFGVLVSSCLARVLNYLTFDKCGTLNSCYRRELG